MEEVDRRRLMAKVARLYHHSALRQVEIADRLRISQTRVSRLLQQAQDHGIVRTVVVPLLGLNVEIEEALERHYGLAEVYVVDAVSEDEVELTAELGEAAAAILTNLPVDVPVIGLTSWSRTLGHMIDSLPSARTGTSTVVEMLGDLGPPEQQHEAAGAVGQICLRFLDVRGAPVESPLDGLVTGVTLEQLRSAKRRWVVAGGPSKYTAIRAVLLGGWADTFVTDAATARWLLSPAAALPS